MLLYAKGLSDAYYQRTDLAEDVQKNLSQIFNRDFTTAYLEKKQGKFMMSDKRPNNRGRLIGRVVRYDDKTRRAVIKLTEDVAVGDTIDFWVKVGGRVSTNVSAIFVKNKEAAACLNRAAQKLKQSQNNALIQKSLLSGRAGKG